MYIIMRGKNIRNQGRKKMKKVKADKECVVYSSDNVTIGCLPCRECCSREQVSVCKKSFVKEKGVKYLSSKYVQVIKRDREGNK